MVTDEKHQGWSNRETWAFMLWVDSSQPLQNFARSWVGDTAKNGDETKEFIRLVKDLVQVSQRPHLLGWNSDATIMLGDIGTIASFRKVEPTEVANHLNEFFEDGG